MLNIEELNLLNPYEYMDSELDSYRRLMVNRFRKIRLAKKGLLGTVNKVYAFLYSRSYKMYLRLAKWYYEKSGGDKKRPNDEWLQDFLEEYDFITGYQYDPEWDRKRARTYELAQSYREENRVPDLKRPLTLLNQQVTEKSIEVVDRAVIRAYKDQGITKIRWRTMEDEKVCAICEERDGKIFSIDNIPEKHYNCRCWFEKYEDRRTDT